MIKILTRVGEVRAKKNEPIGNKRVSMAKREESKVTF